MKKKKKKNFFAARFTKRKKIVVFQNPREREDETKNKRESEIS